MTSPCRFRHARAMVEESIVLSCRRLTKAFPGAVRPAVDHVDLEVTAGEWVAVVGRSGSGKSTLLQTLAGLHQPDSGDVTIAGVTISELGESDRARFRRTHVGYVLQQYNLIDDLSVIDNVALPALLAGWHRRAARAVAASLLEQLALADRATHRPGVLSGGEQQRAAIARALITEPAIVFADEPTGALDTENAAVVIDLLAAIHRDGRTIVMVTHDLDVARRTSRTVTFSDGRIADDTAAVPPLPAITAGP